MTAVALALCASLAWGVADFGAGVGARRLPAFVVAAGMQIAGLAVAAIVLAVLREPVPRAGEVGWAIFAGLAGVLGLSAFYRALAVGTMGIVGPISSLSALVPLTYGLARGERPSTLHLAGVALAISGGIGASLEPVPDSARRRIGAGVGLALLAALGFGGSLVGLSNAAPGGIGWATFVMRAAAAPTLLVLALSVGGRRPGGRLLPLLVAVGIFDTGANLLYSAATTRGLLSVVSVLASLYPIVIVVLARVFLHERVASPQLAGVGVALAGVAMISA
ncbi:MAG TPA: DMT family transporter [Gaiellaceae bacterium]|nr:DMT family transporter [Gaiellaceae bacterium]